MKIFSKYNLGNMELKNRIVMCPMTRSRTINNIPNDIMAKYYEQRADAGLIITEGTSPSPNGLGYARIPGIFSYSKIQGWKRVTDAVHRKNGNIFLQIMHDHNPPPFHARYGSYKAAIRVEDFAVLEGYLPPRALGLVVGGCLCLMLQRQNISKDIR